MIDSISLFIYHVMLCSWSLWIPLCLFKILGIKKEKQIGLYLLGNVLSYSICYFAPVWLGISTFPVPYLYTYIVRFLLLLLWAFWLLKGTLIQKLLYCSFYISFYKCFALMYIPLYELFFHIDMTFYRILDYGSYLLQGVMLYLFTLFLMRHTLIFQNKFGSRDLLLMLYCPLSFFVITEFPNQYEILPKNVMAAMLAVLLAINILIIYYLCATITQNYETTIKLNQMLTESRAQLSRYRYTIIMEEELSKERHELNNKYFYIQMLLKENRLDELESYLEKQTHKNLGDKSKVNTGNTLMDYIINTKMKDIEKRNINILVDTVVPQNLSVNDDVLCTILLNLFDNAIEACEKVKNPDIHIVIKCVEHYLAVKVMNKTDSNVLKFNPRLVTTKNNRKLHGHGVKIIQELVNKNDGLYDIKIQNNYFVFTVMLPLNS